MAELRSPRRAVHVPPGRRLTEPLERGVGALVEAGLPVLDRSCATLACALGAIGVVLGLVPLFFGLAWNFGGVAVALAIYAHHRRERGEVRITPVSRPGPASSSVPAPSCSARWTWRSCSAASDRDPDAPRAACRR